MDQSKELRFKQIIEENCSRINSICSYYNSNAEDRKDMHQEILVNIWKSLDKFRGESAISTWIYRIAVNTSLSFTGKAYRHMNLSLEGAPQSMSLLLDDEELEQKKTTEQHLEELETQLNLLSVIEKALISLVIEGLSMREIADVIGLTEPNVKVKIHRIKEHLKQQLNNHGNN
ncbi:MAG: sigma-70 family RNA polymerase sigma factor [Verrucomicrobia bacterium]|nr:sigma-70 family RNA polymerase sigma factor [Prolixibacteraceae bacterium]